MIYLDVNFHQLSFLQKEFLKTAKEFTLKKVMAIKDASSCCLFIYVPTLLCLNLRRHLKPLNCQFTHSRFRSYDFLRPPPHPLRYTYTYWITNNSKTNIIGLHQDSSPGSPASQSSVLQLYYTLLILYNAGDSSSYLDTTIVIQYFQINLIAMTQTKRQNQFPLTIIQ